MSKIRAVAPPMLLRELAPFLAAAALAWVTIAVSAGVEIIEYLASILLLALAGGLTLLRRPAHRMQWLGVVPASLVFLAAVAVLRNSAGGISSGAGGLALAPGFYTALHSERRRDLVVVVVGVAAFCLAPIVLIGGPDYPDSQYRLTLVLVVTSVLIGFATQALVRNVRLQADQAHSRGRMLEQVSETVRSLYVSPRARTDVCEAAQRISNASAAVLYEPTPGSADLRRTATSGIAEARDEVLADPGSAVHRAFQSGRAVLITADHEHPLGSVELWRSAGRPASVLYEPLLKDGVALGVLVVAWPEAIRPDGPRATVAALLAHEAAAVIDRADALDDLTGAALTDALTGLSNRRAWDAVLELSVTQDRTMTVAMLDLDHFKAFNDTYGHPAGDLLLRETAAAWLDQLRPADHLARIGGDEFALLLDCDLPQATEIVQRLRGTVAQNCTCSAGIASGLPGESVESLLARADRALYEAKAVGRDRMCQSV